MIYCDHVKGQIGDMLPESLLKTPFFFSLDQAIDFLDKLLRYDHQDRLTAKEAMVINIYLLWLVSIIANIYRGTFF